MSMNNVPGVPQNPSEGINQRCRYGFRYEDVCQFVDESLKFGRSYKFRNMRLFKEITVNVLNTVFNGKSDIRLQLQSHCDKRYVCLENT